MSRLMLILALVLAGCGVRGAKPWQGYAEGRDVFVEAPQAGWIGSIAVRPGEIVKKGAVLFTLDDAGQRALRDEAEVAISQATGELAKAQTQLTEATRKLARDTSLTASDASRPASEAARNDYQAVEAQVAQIKELEGQAKATLSSAQAQLSRRRIRARSGGRIEEVYYRRGEYVPASTPVISLLPRQNVFVRFFVPEADLADLKMGQSVAISCDGCAGHLTATISFIAPQEQFVPAAFTIANRQELVFKVEARAREGLPLDPGQSVEVRPLEGQAGS